VRKLCVLTRMGFPLGTKNIHNYISIWQKCKLKLKKYKLCIREIYIFSANRHSVTCGYFDFVQDVVKFNWLPNTKITVYFYRILDRRWYIQYSNWKTCTKQTKYIFTTYIDVLSNTGPLISVGIFFLFLFTYLYLLDYTDEKILIPVWTLARILLKIQCLQNHSGVLGGYIFLTIIHI
jgi:hypothetical protein